MVRLSRIAIHKASSSMIAKTRHSTKIAMRRKLVMMPLNEAPKSWLYRREGRDSTRIRTLSRSPVSQSVMDSVEVNRTGRSATLTGGGCVPPTIHDFSVTTSGPITREESFPAGWEFSLLESAGFELAAPEFAAPAPPLLLDGEAFPLLLPGDRGAAPFDVLPTRSGNRAAWPRPSATMFSAAP